MFYKIYYYMVIALLFVSCTSETNTKVIIITETLPPSFQLKGSGYISRFVIYGPLSGEYAKEEDRPIAWKIFPNVESSSKVISDLPPIKFGEPPPGWTQHDATRGAPAPLVEGGVYRVVANTNSANSGFLDFTIQQGRAVSLNP